MSSPREQRPYSRTRATARWVALGLIVLLAAQGVQRLVSAGSWIGVVIVSAVALAVVMVYATKRAVPMKYLLPGVLLLVAFQIYPVVYTVGTAFTNYGDGHRVTKEEAIDLIIANSVHEVPDRPRYRLVTAVAEGGDPESSAPVYLLQAADGTAQVGSRTGLEPVPSADATLNDTGQLISIAGYDALTPAEVNDRSAELDILAIPVSADVAIKKVGLSEAYEGVTNVQYDQATDTLLDQATGTTYAVKDARFVATDGSGVAFPQGWAENVGWANFERLAVDPSLRNGFLGIFVWNIAFAVLSVLSTFVVGLFVAMLLNNPGMRHQRLYRSLLILPYAIPGFVSALVWASMFNRDFGLINTVTGLEINWLGEAGWSKVALLLANLWLGFPYMFLICTGALQSIPAELKEAAMIDGASPFRVLRAVVVPLLLVSVGPLLIASFAFNFNNFGLVYLLTGGGPFSSSDPNLGGSDLLISYAFRLAFGSNGADFGFASAVSIVIFLIVALMSATLFRKTAALEEIH